MVKQLMPFPFCVKCKSKSIQFRELKDCKCTCGASYHFEKTCLGCGSVTMIHRTVINDGERRYFFGVVK